MNGRIRWHARTRSQCELRLIEYPPGTRQAVHSHRRDSITLVLSGDLVEGSEQGRQHATSLSVVAKPSGVEHENVFGPGGAHTLQIELPRAQRLTVRTMPRAPIRWEHAGPTCRALLRLLVLLDRSTSEAIDHRLDEVVHQTLADLTFLPALDAPSPPWLEQVRLVLESDSASMDTIARRFRVHPVYLARRFRAQFGVSPATYRARLRVQRAARALLEAEGPLATVALDAGYYDQPHMNRQVRAATGLTPRALRKVADWVRPAARELS